MFVWILFSLSSSLPAAIFILILHCNCWVLKVCVNVLWNKIVLYEYSYPGVFLFCDAVRNLFFFFTSCQVSKGILQLIWDNKGILTVMQLFLLIYIYFSSLYFNLSELNEISHRMFFKEWMHFMPLHGSAHHVPILSMTLQLRLDFFTQNSSSSTF